MIVPDARRLSRDDVDALRAYVDTGGLLYASGHTSSLFDDGESPGDFALADVFGCRLTGSEEGLVLYLRPESTELRNAVQPEAYLPIGQRGISPERSGGSLNLPRITATEGARVIARLTLPYGYPSDGALAAHDFASIHSSPPWEDTAFPAVVGHDYGAGRSVYSSAPIEAGGSAQHEEFFRSLILTELGLEPRLSAQGHPDVWVTGFDQRERHRMVVNALRLVDDPPESATTMTVRLQVPDGLEISGVHEIATGAQSDWRLDGAVVEIAVPVEVFTMVVVELRDALGEKEREDIL